MTDTDTLTAEPAQVIRRKMVKELTPYRSYLPLLPIPSYLRDSLQSAIQALDRWTVESEQARG